MPNWTFPASKLLSTRSAAPHGIEIFRSSFARDLGLLPIERCGDLVVDRFHGRLSVGMLSCSDIPGPAFEHGSHLRKGDPACRQRLRRRFRGRTRHLDGHVAPIDVANLFR
jgi:hypothetical protein